MSEEQQQEQRDRDRSDWTSISVYSTLHDDLSELKGEQTWDEFLVELAEQYDPDEAAEIEFEPPDERSWKTIGMHQGAYDNIDSLKGSRTFNELFAEMVEQYSG